MYSLMNQAFATAWGLQVGNTPLSCIMSIGVGLTLPREAQPEPLYFVLKIGTTRKSHGNVTINEFSLKWDTYANETVARVYL